MPHPIRPLFGAVALLVATSAPLAAQTVPRIGLLPGEEVSVDVYARPELSGNRQIDAAGQIALPLVGRIDAQGLTEPELEEKIVSALRKSGLDQGASVLVTATRRLDVYVDGAVSNPGAYPWRPGLTVAQVMALAGGRVSVSSDELGPTLNALRSVEYAAAMERRAQSLTLLESRILSEMTHVQAAYAEGGDSAIPAAGFFAVSDRLAANPALAELIDTQADVFRQNTDNRAKRHASLLDQERLTAERLDLLRKRKAEIERETAIVTDRLNAFQALAEKGLAKATDIMNLQRASSSANSSLLEIIASISETELSLAQRKLDIATFAGTARGELATELSRVRADLLDVRARLDPATRAGMVGASYEGAADGLPAVGSDKVGMLDDSVHYAIARIGIDTDTAAETAGMGASLVMPGDTITVSNGAE